MPQEEEIRTRRHDKWARKDAKRAERTPRITEEDTGWAETQLTHEPKFRKEIGSSWEIAVSGLSHDVYQSSGVLEFNRSIDAELRSAKWSILCRVACVQTLAHWIDKFKWVFSRVEGFVYLTDSKLTVVTTKNLNIRPKTWPFGGLVGSTSERPKEERRKDQNFSRLST